MGGFLRTRRSRHLVVAALLASVVALAVFTGTAAAAPSYVGGITIDSATRTPDPPVAGQPCTWDVKFTGTVVNLSSSPVTVSDVSGPDGLVSWSYAPNNTGNVTPNIVMTWPNGGAVAANGGTLSTTTGDATFKIPCNATQGDLAVYFTVTDSKQQTTTFSGDKPFLTNDTPLPLAAGLSGLLVALLLGGTLLMRQRRSAKTAAH